MASITSLVNSTDTNGIDFSAYLNYISVQRLRTLKPRLNPVPSICIDVTEEKDSVILEPPSKKQKIALQEKRAVVVNPKPRIQLVSSVDIDKTAVKSFRKKFRSQAKCTEADYPKNKKVLSLEETIKGCFAGVRDLVGNHTFGMEGFTLKCRQGMLGGGFIVTLTARSDEFVLMAPSLKQIIKGAIRKAVSIMFDTYCRTEPRRFYETDLQQGEESNILGDTLTFSVEIVKEVEIIK